MEKTFVMIKPDAIKKILIGEIIKRYQNGGLRIVGIKIVHPDRKLLEKHYPDADSQVVEMGNKTIQSAKDMGKPEKIMELFNTEDPRKIGLTLREWCIKFMLSSPVIAIVFEGEDAIKTARKLTGFTDPSKADKGTIRGDFGEDSIDSSNSERRATENLVHASGNEKEAQNEINLWFAEEEIVKY